MPCALLHRFVHVSFQLVNRKAVTKNGLLSAAVSLQLLVAQHARILGRSLCFVRSLKTLVHGENSGPGSWLSHPSVCQRLTVSLFARKHVCHAKITHTQLLEAGPGRHKYDVFMRNPECSKIARRCSSSTAVEHICTTQLCLQENDVIGHPSAWVCLLPRGVLVEEVSSPVAVRVTCQLHQHRIVETSVVHRGHRSSVCPRTKPLDSLEKEMISST